MTLKELAMEARVSTSTVSKALNNSPDISEETKKYIDKVLSRLTVLGASFLVVISGLPIIFSKFTSLPTSVTIGGTGLLIVVGVALETYKQLEGSLLSRSYKRGYSRR